MILSNNNTESQLSQTLKYILIGVVASMSWNGYPPKWQLNLNFCSSHYGLKNEPDSITVLKKAQNVKTNLHLLDLCPMLRHFNSCWFSIASLFAIYDKIICWYQCLHCRFWYTVLEVIVTCLVHPFNRPIFFQWLIGYSSDLNLQK